MKLVWMLLTFALLFQVSEEIRLRKLRRSGGFLFRTKKIKLKGIRNPLRNLKSTLRGTKVKPKISSLRNNLKKLISIGGRNNEEKLTSRPEVKEITRDHDLKPVTPIKANDVNLQQKQQQQSFEIQQNSQRQQLERQQGIQDQQKRKQEKQQKQILQQQRIQQRKQRQQERQLRQKLRQQRLQDRQERIRKRQQRRQEKQRRRKFNQERSKNVGNGQVVGPNENQLIVTGSRDAGNGPLITEPQFSQNERVPVQELPMSQQGVQQDAGSLFDSGTNLHNQRVPSHESSHLHAHGIPGHNEQQMPRETSQIQSPQHQAPLEWTGHRIPNVPCQYGGCVANRVCVLLNAKDPAICDSGTIDTCHCAIGCITEYGFLPEGETRPMGRCKDCTCVNGEVKCIVLDACAQFLQQNPNHWLGTDANPPV